MPALIFPFIVADLFFLNLPGQNKGFLCNLPVSFVKTTISRRTSGWFLRWYPSDRKPVFLAARLLSGGVPC